MKCLLITIFSFLTLTVLGQQSSTLNLMPVPSKTQLSDGKFRITDQLTVSVTAQPDDSVLYRAVNRAYQTLNRKTGVMLRQQYIVPNDTTKNIVMQVSVASKAAMDIGVDESYSLEIDKAHIKLSSPNTIGALRGLQTLIQLSVSDNEGFYFPCVVINDAPRFKWRGLMIDVARHFISADEIERNLDAMCTVKMNVMHWHLSDDEGFRVESKPIPIIAGKGFKWRLLYASAIKGNCKLCGR